MSVLNGTLRYLYDLQRFGIKAGLSNIAYIAGIAGNPHRGYPIIHIAGTNGKGSTAAMIAAVLTQSGYKTGLYTSPHLVSFNERIRIDGVPISDEALAGYTSLLRPFIDRAKATFFEATTAIAFCHFADAGVDAVVLETGLGGRLDATNIVDPVLTIITSIGMDHTAELGSTLGAIAGEKGGILKNGVRCITGDLPSEAASVIAGIARRRKVPLESASELCRLTVVREGLEGTEFDVTTPAGRYPGLMVGLAGPHQFRNLPVSLRAVEYLSGECGFGRISQASIRQAMGNIRSLSGFRGRLDLLKTNPLIIADVAHNPPGAEILAMGIRRLVHGRVCMVFGVMADKDYPAMLRSLKGAVRVLVAVAPPGGRALKSSAVTAAARAAGISSFEGGSVHSGLGRGMDELRNGEPLVVTGSHYVVGEAMKHLTLS